MDYCHPCRRHLNGALACPGCGTPIEGLRAYADEGDARPLGDAFDGGDERYDDANGSGEAGASPEDRAARPGRAQNRRRAQGRGVSGDPDGGRGTRSGRRDRKAAAHRRRRRRVLFVGAGLLLAAGGLSLAELGIEAPGSTPKTATAGEESADGEAALGETTVPSGGTGGRGVAGAASASASSSASPSASASASAKDEKSDKGGQKDGGTPSATPTGRPDRPAPAPTPTASRAPGTTPSANPAPTSSRPEPSPTKKCNRFLWWCT
ncbi:hypothetical protein [Streptomyces sp. NPDC047079]|uniref:SCO2400 family protein n=1 Tax=Streptomyces sp. NPDC047079 TaxID=3154607 RepID=UPI003406D9E3